MEKEQKKVLSGATEHLDAYDESRDEASKNRNEAVNRAKEAQKQLQKKSAR